MSRIKGLSRREVLELGAASGLAALAAASPARAAGRGAVRARNGQPRNIIFMVSDGMSLGVPSMAEPFSRMARNQPTRWYALLGAPDAAHGYFETWSLSSLVTDSSAASSAWGSGSRVANGAVNVLPDGQRLVPIGRLVHESGRGMGLVTTTTITHATPAGFASVQESRGDEPQIAPQYLDVVDVLMGGGIEHFHAEKRADKRDLIAEYRAKGYTFWDRREDVTGGARPERVLGLFTSGHLPYTIDQRNQPDLAARVPTLAEMTKAALEMLGRREAGFLLQVEGGRVDHAAHGNDAAALLWDQLAFDDAVGVALEFAGERGDTLVVITSDHGNANPGLNGTGSGYRRSDECLARLKDARMSFDVLGRRAPRVAGAASGAAEGSSAAAADAGADSAFGDFVRQATGMPLRDAEVATIRAAMQGDLPPELHKQHMNLVGILGQMLGNYNGVGWTGVSHTEDLVLLTAVGPGAERFAGLLKNTDAFVHMTELMGITHKNPSLSPDVARPYLAAAAPVELTPHWV